MSDNCRPDQYYDKPACQCMPCEDICLPVYDTLRQCIRDCMDFALEEGYIVVRGHVQACKRTADGLNPLYILPIMLGVMLVTAIFVLFMEKRYNISAKLPCLGRPKLGGVQAEDRAQNLNRENAQLVTSGV